MPKTKDLTLQKFGKLTALQKTSSPNPKDRHSYWLCICDCQKGKENPEYRKVNSYSLTSGNTQSCGCVQKEKLINWNKSLKEFNSYDLSGEYGIGYTKKGEEFYFDLEDYDLLKDYVWRKNLRGYIVASDQKQKHVSIHRIIMKPNDESDVDHINGENSRHDNRKYNLRICSRSQNMMNKNLREDNSSGVTGVSWTKNIQKWKSYICVNGKVISLGYYENKEDAINERKKAEEKYFGEYAYSKKVYYK